MFGTTLLQHRFEKYRYDAVTPGTVFVMYLQLHKVLVSNSEGILSYSGLKKSPVSHDKNMLLFGKCL